MSAIVQTVTRLTVGLILLYGIYLVLHGHLTPGGGFPGGVVIALSFVHIVLAFGKRKAFETLAENRTAALESIGAALFLLIALWGFAGGDFFANALPAGAPHSLLSGGTIPLSNLAICLKVGGGLYAVFLALVLLNPEGKQP
jgi:multicomponent Na+:H+ antiporter subunit B